MPADARHKDHRRVGALFAALIWAVLLLVLAPGAWGEPAAQPEIDDDPEGAPYVAGELLVAYEPGTPEEAERAAVRETGGRSVENLEEQEARLVSFPEIKEEGSEAARERALERARQVLEGDPRVVAADYNYIREASFTPDDPRFDAQWGLRKPGFEDAWNDARGGAVRIAVVDSGVFGRHADLRTKVATQRDVVNLSFGGPKKSAVLKRTVDDAWQRGAVVVAAAGNGGTTRPDYPAAYSSVIAVSATDRSDRLAGFSNRGNWVDLAAPGVGILSTAPGGGYARQSGTSLSAPFVSALAGLLASQQLSAPQIRKRMENTAKDLGPSGKDPYYGWGRINAARAVR